VVPRLIRIAKTIKHALARRQKFLAARPTEAAEITCKY